MNGRLNRQGARRNRQFSATLNNVSALSSVGSSSGSSTPTVSPRRRMGTTGTPFVQKLVVYGTSSTASTSHFTFIGQVVTPSVRTLRCFGTSATIPPGGVTYVQLERSIRGLNRGLA